MAVKRPISRKKNVTGKGKPIEKREKVTKSASKQAKRTISKSKNSRVL